MFTKLPVIIDTSLLSNFRSKPTILIETEDLANLFNMKIDLQVTRRINVAIIHSSVCQRYN